MARNLLMKKDKTIFFIITDEFPVDLRKELQPCAWLEERGFSYIAGCVHHPIMTMNAVTYSNRPGALSNWLKDMEATFRDSGPAGKSLKSLIDDNFSVIDSFIFKVKIADVDHSAQYKLCWGWVWDGRSK